MDIESLAHWIRNSHITIGLVGLVAYWIPVIAKKGGKLHIYSGRVFEWCGYYVATTALFSCARYLLTPRHFAFFVDRSHESPEELVRVEGAQFFLTILAFLAVTFLFQLRTGMRTVRVLKRSPEKYRNWEATVWLYGYLFAAIALTAFGVYRIASGGIALHWISISLGAFSILEFRKELAFHRNPQAEAMSWWYKHMECMLGCGVAFHTAGLLFALRWLSRNHGISLPTSLMFIPWILPSLIGIPVTNRWIGYYREKFGDSEIMKISAPTLPANATLSSE